MREAKEADRAQKRAQKLREHQQLQKRQSQVSMRHEPSIASHASIDTVFGRNKVYDVENVMKDAMFDNGEQFYSTLDKKCALKTFTIKDL